MPESIGLIVAGLVVISVTGRVPIRFVRECVEREAGRHPDINATVADAIAADTMIVIVPVHHPPQNIPLENGDGFPVILQNPALPARVVFRLPLTMMGTGAVHDPNVGAIPVKNGDTIDHHTKKRTDR